MKNTLKIILFFLTIFSSIVISTSLVSAGQCGSATYTVIEGCNGDPDHCQPITRTGTEQCSGNGSSCTAWITASSCYTSCVDGVCECSFHDGGNKEIACGNGTGDCKRNKKGQCVPDPTCDNCPNWICKARRGCDEPPPPPVCDYTCPVGQTKTPNGAPAPDVNGTIALESPKCGPCRWGNCAGKCYWLNPQLIASSIIIDGTSPEGCRTQVTAGRYSNETVSSSFVFALGTSKIMSVANLFARTGDPVTTIVTEDNNKNTIANITTTSFSIRAKRSGPNNTWSGLYAGVGDKWQYIGTIGTGLRGTIYKDGKKYVDIYDAGIVETSASVTLKYRMEFANKYADAAKNATPDDGKYTLYGSGNVDTGIVMSGGKFLLPYIWTASPTSFIQDTTNPVVESINFVALSTQNNAINLNWKVSDALSGAYRIIGDATRPVLGSSTSTIDDRTSKVYNYVLGSGAKGANTFNGSHLWLFGVASPAANAVSMRSENIRLRSNIGGSVEFQVGLFDQSCNYVSNPKSLNLGDSWITTKGSMVFSDGGSSLTIPDISGHNLFSMDPYWKSPFSFYADEVDVSTELLSGLTMSSNQLFKQAKLKNSGISSVVDSNNHQNYWYDNLSKRLAKSVSDYTSQFSTVNTVTPTISGQMSKWTYSKGGGATEACSVNGVCIVKSTGNMNVSTLTCDRDAVFMSDGDIYVTPNITSINNKTCVFVAKNNIQFEDGTYQSSGSSYPKYDLADGVFIADNQLVFKTTDIYNSLALFNGGVWKIAGSNQNYGNGTSIPAPADYDGDGDTDVAYCNPSTGIINVKGGSTYNVGCTASSKIVSGDYNGDGIDEAAVFIEASGTWKINGMANVTYGGSGDIPVPADYNGDGKTDIAVYNKSTTMWNIRNVGSGKWGATGDIPVPGDYNGDGKADLAVYRASNQTWYVAGVGNTKFGNYSNEIPVPYDYNSDGVMDFAVYRPSTGVWTINGMGTYTYGLSSDTPVPGAYTPIRDGLKITGAVYGFGSNATTGVKLERSLGLYYNNLYPPVAIHYDNRYLSFLKTVFKNSYDTFKKEVGYKPL